ncbi:penicillin-binding transpeptidase domain-containing protein [Bacillus sp. FJAT-50079]|uniref:penicillin-binding transpeptidase domain-containing protein n=1 Tax=Bacillus sp. FJAT-50079 TaxID=2833577 RepID=UPI001BC9AA6F|nr:penicillin-binding transpeptidase domain-containing protein [Bacillus sp. FJAT-50079]MBS4210308.1 penicillin-binding transpeptidase domain-containing protein [Bacillus sp. FJAT-50079]
MKKFMIVSCLLIFAVIMAGCNKEEKPKPEDRFAEYVDLWNKQKFSEMYTYLSTEAKESISKEEFTDRYQKIYTDLRIDQLSVQFNAPDTEDKKEELTEVQFPFSATMESSAGKMAFDYEATLVKEELDETTNWYIDWNTTYIFPELDAGDKVSISTTQAKRGDILDKNGIELAETGIALQIGIVPEQMEGQEEAIKQNISELLGMSVEQIDKALNASWVKPNLFVPIKTVAADNSELLEKLYAIQAVQSMKTEARIYPLGEAAAHLTGNIGTITAEEIEKSPEKNYGSNDVIGKRGLEKVLEDRLRGENGIKIIIKKEDGSEVVLAEKPVQDGENVQLTIDAMVQRAVYEEFNGQAGTAAAIDPITGETLALVSSPSFDPTALSLGATNEQWTALQEDPQSPLTIRFNKTFAPGSVLKPITAAIGLNNGTINWDEALSITGLTWQKDSSWGGYNVKRVSDYGEPINLEKALVYSDNIYFAQKALELGNDAFISGLKSFAFDEDIPYLYPMEVSQIGNIDNDIALADSSYGQGQVEMSILHLASTYTPFINKGNMIKPILEINEEKGQVWKEKVVSEENAEKIQNALRKVIDDPKGTARAAKIEGYPLAGKTGTAELKEKQGEKGKENGWFVAYHAEAPDLLVAFMLEDSGSGPVVEKVKNIFTKVKQ